jgi:hypothetical protein
VAVGEGDLDYEGLLQQSPFEAVHLIEYEQPFDFAAGVNRSLDALKKWGFSVVRA